MRLFIAEKPSAAKAIADVLGNARRKDGYYQCGTDVVSYCIGHLFSQKEPDAYLPNDIPKTKKGKKIWRASDLPIIPSVWKYEAKKETKAQLKILGSLIKKAEQIVHAGDVDREGQAIVDQVLEHFKTTLPVKRFCVSAQDPISIGRGLRSLKDNADFQGWRNASLGRQRADWLVGMNMSRALTLAAQARGDRSLLVVGRVQSPTLTLVVERDRLIEKFIPKLYYQVHAKIKHQNGEFYARWVPNKDSKFLDEESRIIDKSVAEKAVTDLSKTSGNVTNYLKTAKSTPQPLGLSLSDITLVASNRFGYSADATLKTVQALYEKHKLCSYPRSDCQYLPAAQKSDATAILAAVATTYPAVSKWVDKANTEIHSRIWNDKKITAHHAIVPTMQRGNVNNLSAMETRIYDVIVRNYLAQFYPKHEYDATSITIETDNNYILKAAGNVVTKIGWKVITSSADDMSKKNPSVQALPIVKKSDRVNVSGSKIETKETIPPKHFTEGTLIKALEQIHRYIDNNEYKKLLKEDDGIGTPATRSSIITELKRRKYLDAKGKYLISNSLGRRLVDTLPESVTSPVLTARYERELLLIQNKNGSLDEFVQSQIRYVSEQVANAATLIANSPAAETTTSDARSTRKARSAQVASKATPMGALESEPEIATTIKPGNKATSAQGKARSNKKSNNVEHLCTECDSKLIRRKNVNRGKGFWWGCSDFPNCKQTYSDKRGKPDFNEKRPDKSPVVNTEHKCKKCESLLVSRKSANGTVWYGCSTFPKCKQRYFDKGGKPDY